MNDSSSSNGDLHLSPTSPSKSSFSALGSGSTPKQLSVSAIELRDESRVIGRAHVRLSAGREAMSDELQALAFLAGANSIFYGEKLLTTGNPELERDRRLLSRLGMRAESAPHS